MKIKADRQIIPSKEDMPDAVVSGQSLDCKVHALLSGFQMAMNIGKRGLDPEQGFLDFLNEIVK